MVHNNAEGENILHTVAKVHEHVPGFVKILTRKLKNTLKKEELLKLFSHKDVKGETAKQLLDEIIKNNQNSDITELVANIN